MSSERSELQRHTIRGAYERALDRTQLRLMFSHPGADACFEATSIHASGEIRAKRQAFEACALVDAELAHKLFFLRQFFLQRLTSNADGGSRAHELISGRIGIQGRTL